MSSLKNIKKYLIRIVCMVMLVLIQFDVCGYDLMRACYLAEKPSSTLLDFNDVGFNENDDNVSEWSDPVYRNVNLRNFIKAPFMEFFSFLFTLCQRELPFTQWFAHVFQAELLNSTYLRFCVFLI